METQELINFINSLSFEETVKKELVDKIKNGTPLQQVVFEVEALITAGEKELDTKNPEASAEYKTIMNDYSNEVENASAEFNKKISDLEEEIDSLDSEVSKKLDSVRIEELQTTV